MTVSSIQTGFVTQVTWHTWQKIIPNQHAEQDKIIDDALHIEGKWQCVAPELQL